MVSATGGHGQAGRLHGRQRAFHNVVVEITALSTFMLDGIYQQGFQQAAHINPQRHIANFDIRHDNRHGLPTTRHRVVVALRPQVGTDIIVLKRHERPETRIAHIRISRHGIERLLQVLQILDRISKQQLVL